MQRGTGCDLEAWESAVKAAVLAAGAHVLEGLLEDVGWMIGPAVGGWLLNYWDLRAPFIFGAIAALLGIPLYYVGKRYIPAMQEAKAR